MTRPYDIRAHARAVAAKAPTASEIVVGPCCIDDERACVALTYGTSDATGSPMIGALPLSSIEDHGAAEPLRATFIAELRAAGLKVAALNMGALQLRRANDHVAASVLARCRSQLEE